MTIGLKNPSSYYMELINAFPPRPITNDAELSVTQAQINSILDRGRLSQDDRDYLKVLGMLVYDYEEQHEPIPKLQGIGLLKALIEESTLQPQDVVSIFGSESALSEILDHKSQLTESQMQALASLFYISPDSFQE